TARRLIRWSRTTRATPPPPTSTRRRMHSRGWPRSWRSTRRRRPTWTRWTTRATRAPPTTRSSGPWWRCSRSSAPRGSSPRRRSWASPSAWTSARRSRASTSPRELHVLLGLLDLAPVADVGDHQEGPEHQDEDAEEPEPRPGVADEDEEDHRGDADQDDRPDRLRPELPAQRAVFVHDAPFCCVVGSIFAERGRSGLVRTG